jgi:hypothetical protein
MTWNWSCSHCSVILRSQRRTTVRAVLGALTVAVLCATSAQRSPATDANAMLWTSAPSADDSGAWRWAMAAPGMNIYVSYRYARREGSIVTAWVDREYYRNPAGIGKSIIELMQFDCERMATRRLTDVSANTMTNWEQQPSGSVVERVAREVCVNTNPQVRRPGNAGG